MPEYNSKRVAPPPGNAKKYIPYQEQRKISVKTPLNVQMSKNVFRKLLFSVERTMGTVLFVYSRPLNIRHKTKGLFENGFRSFFEYVFDDTIGREWYMKYMLSPR